VVNPGFRYILAAALALGAGSACALLFGIDEGTPRAESLDGASPEAPSVDAPSATGPDADTAKYGDVTDLARWELFQLNQLADPTLDAGTIGSFSGALFDGARVTFIPFAECNGGTVATFAVAKPFTEAASWSAFDLSTLHAEGKGYTGGVFDGKRIYLAPSCHLDPDTGGQLPSSTVATYDVSSSDPTAWQFHSTTLAVGNTGSFHGAAFDGRYVYYAPATSGHVVQYDTLGRVDAATSFSEFDATKLVPPASWFAGAIFDGRYVYFAPGTATGCASVVARYDTQHDFLNLTYWTTFDLLKSYNPGISWCRFGGVFDGRYLYLVPYGGGVVARFDTTLDFASGASWSVFLLAKLDPGVTHIGGAAFDGRYVYLPPAPESGKPSVVVRFDTGAPFTEPASWTEVDLASKAQPGASVTGFRGAAFDGRWVYFAPAAAPFTAARFDSRTPTALPPTYRGSFY
jgi:hypothetical protein